MLIAASLLAYLHVRSGAPVSAALHPMEGNPVAVKPAIEFNAYELTAALAAGDVEQVMRLTRQPRTEVEPFVAAFGGRPDTLTGLRVSEDYVFVAEATVVVPCRTGPAQRPYVTFSLLRTSWISSSWFGYVKPPGVDGEPTGCAKP